MKHFVYLDTAKQYISLTPKIADCHSDIVLPLPDGKFLAAVAIEDENFPAINIYLCGSDGLIENKVCFVEYNSEREGSEICTGIYFADTEEPSEYVPFKRI